MLLNVSDVRQWAYCERVVYYRYYGPPFRPTTFKMAEGRRQHERVELLEHRRSLRTYGVESGERVFDVWVQSESLGVCGRLDMAIVLPDAVIPVEFKNTTGPLAENQRLQLAAYAMLAEDHWQRPAPHGYVYLVPGKRSIGVPIDPSLRERVRAAVTEIRGMLELQRFPPPTPVRGRCRDCEYRRFCNDVD